MKIRSLLSGLPAKAVVHSCRSTAGFSLAFLLAMSCAFSAAAQENDAASAVREQSFDGWTLRCVATAGVSAEQDGTASACEISEAITVSQENGTALEVLKLAISPAADKAGKAGWALVVLFPLDVLLSADFGLETGKAKPRLYRYRNCNHLGCFGVVPVDRAMADSLSKAADGSIYFRLGNGKTVKVSVPLKGFSAAFKALVTETSGAARQAERKGQGR